MSLEKKTRSRSPDSSDMSQNVAQKKARFESKVYNSQSALKLILVSFGHLPQLGSHSPMSTALDIQKALSNIKLLQSIGNCPSRIQDYKYDHGDEMVEDQEDVEDKADKGQKDTNKKEQKINKVRIVRSQKLSLGAFKHSYRRQSTSFVIYSTTSQFPQRAGITRRHSISESLVKGVNSTTKSLHIPMKF